MAVRQFAVSLQYRDGASALLGPVSTRSEARALLERSRNSSVEVARIVRWSGSQGFNGVIRRTPAPAAAAAVIPPSVIDITDVQSSAEETLELLGTDLDQASRFRVVDDFSFDSFYYDSAGPNSGLNPVGSTVTVTPTLVTIVDPALVGITITYVQARDSGDAVVDEWYGSTTVDSFPLLEGICSPVPDTVRFTGQRFLTATAGPVGYVVPRMADYAAGVLLNGANMIVELASPAANWTVVTHTDTMIELSNPDFTAEEPSGGPGDFVVNGVAFHDPTATTFYYYEPWGDPSPYSAPIDGIGC